MTTTDVPPGTTASATTVKVRPLSHPEAQRMLDGETVTGFSLDNIGGRVHLVPTTFTMEDRRRFSQRGFAGEPIFPVKTRRTATGDRTEDDEASAPIGFQVHYTSRTMYGTESGGRVYTTPEAERLRESDPNRRVLHGDPRYFVEDPEGTQAPVAPVYGAQVSLSLIVKGVDPEEAHQRVLDALAAAFAPEERLRVHKGKARPVKDKRVNVFTGHGKNRRLVAANVLDAEAFYVVPDDSGSVSTEVAAADVVIGD